MLNDFGVIFLYLIGGVGFTLMVLFLNWLIRPKKPNKNKELSYECGLDTQGPTWIQFKISYFMYALIFVVFDVETVFLYPWAVAFKQMGLFVFGEMIVFVAILALGLWYAWKEGALEWK